MSKGVYTTYPSEASVFATNIDGIKDKLSETKINLKSAASILKVDEHIRATTYSTFNNVGFQKVMMLLNGDSFELVNN